VQSLTSRLTFAVRISFVISLEVRPSRTYFSGPKKQLETMFQCLRVKDKNAYWKMQHIIRKVVGSFYLSSDERDKRIAKVKAESGYIKFYELRGNSFGTGLLRRVVRHLKTLRIPYRVTDFRKHLVLSEEGARFRFREKVEIRPEQISVLRIALRKKSGIIHCATNAGKTIIAAGIIAEVDHQKGK
jgi:hypothetical protein